MFILVFLQILQKFTLVYDLFDYNFPFLEKLNFAFSFNNGGCPQNGNGEDFNVLSFAVS
jgi:hypothetical protein